jgi:hypothetical protein
MSKPGSAEAVWLVGIDLGTTHTAVAASPLGTDPAIQLVKLDQSIKPGEVAQLALLPSVRYQASLDELAPSDLPCPGPWPRSRRTIGRLSVSWPGVWVQKPPGD